MTPPRGCICVDDDLCVQRIRILGLGGSMRYRYGTHQYTEEMRTRIRKLWMKLIRYKGFDILLTHSPARGLNDGEDLPHQGFECFRTLMEKYKPKYFIHGHVHMSYGRKYKRIDQYQDTVIINGYDQYVFDYENPDFSSEISRAGTHMSNSFGKNGPSLSAALHDLFLQTGNVRLRDSQDIRHFFLGLLLPVQR